MEDLHWLSSSLATNFVSNTSVIELSSLELDGKKIEPTLLVEVYPCPEQLMITKSSGAGWRN
jgi:hypothetical protein